MFKKYISIIIPTKNEGNYLKQSLKQYVFVKKQLGIEVIVSDGNSSDDTVKIAKKYADKVVLPIKGKQQNIAIGRNAGASVAKGEILFHTDADVIIPKKVLFFRRVQQIFKDKNVVAVTSRLKVYRSEETMKDRFFHFIINNLVRFSILLGSFLGRGECQFVRASVFNKIKGYNEKIVLGEDGDLFSRLSKFGKIIYLNDFFIYHSPRRFRNEGYFKVFSQYFLEGLSLYFKGKSRLKEWKPSR